MEQLLGFDAGIYVGVTLSSFMFICGGQGPVGRSILYTDRSCLKMNSQGVTVWHTQMLLVSHRQPGFYGDLLLLI